MCIFKEAVKKDPSLKDTKITIRDYSQVLEEYSKDMDEYGRVFEKYYSTPSDELSAKTFIWHCLQSNSRRKRRPSELTR